MIIRNIDQRKRIGKLDRITPHHRLYTGIGTDLPVVLLTDQLCHIEFRLNEPNGAEGCYPDIIKKSSEFRPVVQKAAVYPLLSG